MRVFFRQIQAYILIILVSLSAVFSTANSASGAQKRVKTQMSDLDTLFDLTKLPEMTLTVTAEEWNKLLDYFDANPKNEKVIKGDFLFLREGKKVQLRDIGLRVRGNSFSRERPEGAKNENHNSSDPDWHHAHFRLNFDEYQSQDFMGLKSLNLKWFNNDPSYVREVYCYDLFRRFEVWPALRVSYVRLSIEVKGTKKAYFGIYEMMEPVDSRYLEKRFPGNDKGYLWKCLYPSSLRPGGAKSKMGVEDPDKGKNYAYDLKTNKKDLEKAKLQFSQFMNDLQDKEGRDFEKWIESAFNLDLFLRTLAAHVMVGMWDDYWNLGNNFYLYFDEKGKATFIPYDYDNSLGTSGMFDAGKQNIYAYGKMDGSKPLVEKILAVPRYKKIYTGYIRQLLDPEKGLFDMNASIARIQKWHTLIEPYVENDTGEDMDIEDAPAGWGKTSYYRLWDEDESVNYFAVRKEYALMQMGMADTKYIVLHVEVDTAALPVEHLYIKGNTHPLSFYSSTELRDDGKEGDIQAGDGIYSINLAFSNIAPLVYRLVGTDAEGKQVGHNKNWSARSHRFDLDQSTNSIKLKLE